MPLAAKVSYSKTKMRSSGSVPTLPTVPTGLAGDKRVCATLLVGSFNSKLGVVDKLQ